MQNHEQPTNHIPNSSCYSVSSFLSFSRPHPSRAPRAKTEKEKKKEMKPTHTYTSRNVIRYQNELGLQVYDTVESVSGMCFFLAILFQNVPELGVEREDTKQKKNRNDDYKSTAHLLHATS